MAIALRGDLASTDIVEVIKRLMEDKASGLLRVIGDSEAKVYFENGVIVYAVSDEAVEGEVVPLLAGWFNGTFSFVPGVEAPGVNVREPTADLFKRLLLEAERWGRLKDAGIYPDARVELAGEISGDVTITPQHWEVLVAISKEDRSCEEITEMLNLSFLDLGEVLMDLTAKGLVKLKGRVAGDDVISQEELDKVKEELTRVVGPIGEVFLEEVLDGFRSGDGFVARKHVPRIMDALSEYIPDKQKRVVFQKNAALILSGGM